MDPGSHGVEGCPSPGMAERGEGSGGCNRGDGLPPGTGNGGCNRSDGLPPVPGTPSQQGSRWVRPCVTAKLSVLRPWFWNLILLNLAPASCYFIVSLGGRARCKHPFIGRRKM